MEANRESADALLVRAHRALSDDDDPTEALRLVLKSLRLYETDEALALQEHITRFGPESAAAAAVNRILNCRAGDNYAVLNLASPATSAQIKKAFRNLSLEVHPDKNHAAGADAAFNRLNDSFGLLLDQQHYETVGDVFRRYSSATTGLLDHGELQAALSGLKRDDLVALDSPVALQLMTNLEASVADGVAMADFRSLVKALKVGAPPPPPPPPPPPRPASATADARVETIGQAFRRRDRDGSGVLDLGEVHVAAVDDLGIDSALVTEALTALEASGASKLSLGDFRSLIKSLRQAAGGTSGGAPPHTSATEQAPQPTAEAKLPSLQCNVTIGSIFRRLDENGTGLLHRDQLAAALDELGVAHYTAALEELDDEPIDIDSFRSLVKFLR